MLRRTAVLILLLFSSVAAASAVEERTARQIETAGSKKPGSTSTVDFGAHGGELQKAGEIQAEVVFARRAIRIYLFDAEGRSISARRARAQLTLQFKNDPRRYRYSLFAESTRKSQGNCLYLPIDLTRRSRRLLPVRCTLRGISGMGSDAIDFEVVYRKPLTPDELAIHRQQTCPVSGRSLRSSRKPVKVVLASKQNVFVCCTNCSSPLRAEPKKYLATEDGGEQRPWRRTPLLSLRLRFARSWIRENSATTGKRLNSHESSYKSCANINLTLSSLAGFPHQRSQDAASAAARLSALR